VLTALKNTGRMLKETHSENNKQANVPIWSQRYTRLAA
jgi:hypothetical protein